VTIPRTATNPNNPLTLYLAGIREQDEALWLYERQRLKKALEISKSHFGRVIDGYGCSLDLALRLHALTDGKEDPRGLTPHVPWAQLDALYRTTPAVD
jgi:hypothetical protein